MDVSIEELRAELKERAGALDDCEAAYDDEMVSHTVTMAQRNRAWSAVLELVEAADLLMKDHNIVQPFLAVVIKHHQTIQDAEVVR